MEVWDLEGMAVLSYSSGGGGGFKIINLMYGSRTFCVILNA